LGVLARPQVVLRVFKNAKSTLWYNGDASPVGGLRFFHGAEMNRRVFPDYTNEMRASARRASALVDGLLCLSAGALWLLHPKGTTALRCFKKLLVHSLPDSNVVLYNELVAVPFCLVGPSWLRENHEGYSAGRPTARYLSAGSNRMVVACLIELWYRKGCLYNERRRYDWSKPISATDAIQKRNSSLSDRCKSYCWSHKHSGQVPKMPGLSPRRTDQSRLVEDILYKEVRCMR
jgi:hypothetical protein